MTNLEELSLSHTSERHSSGAIVPQASGLTKLVVSNLNFIKLPDAKVFNLLEVSFLGMPHLDYPYNPNLESLMTLQTEHPDGLARVYPFYSSLTKLDNDDHRIACQDENVLLAYTKLQELCMNNLDPIRCPSSVTKLTAVNLAGDCPNLKVADLYPWDNLLLLVNLTELSAPYDPRLWSVGNLPNLIKLTLRFDNETLHDEDCLQLEVFPNLTELRLEHPLILTPHAYQSNLIRLHLEHLDQSKVKWVSQCINLRKLTVSGTANDLSSWRSLVNVESFCFLGMSGEGLIELQLSYHMITVTQLG